MLMFVCVEAYRNMRRESDKSRQLLYVRQRTIHCEELRRQRNLGLVTN